MRPKVTPSKCGPGPNFYGGLGSIISMAVARLHPCRMGFVDLVDTYAQSGTAEELMETYGLTGDRIVESATRIVRDE